MTLEGVVVLDIAQHFVERWNEIKKRKVIHTIPEVIFWLNKIITLSVS